LGDHRRRALRFRAASFAFWRRCRHSVPLAALRRLAAFS
jgi:hypothetical protein